MLATAHAEQCLHYTRSAAVKLAYLQSKHIHREQELH